MSRDESADAGTTETEPDTPGTEPDTVTEAASPAKLPARRWPLLVLAAVVIYALDQLTKALAASQLEHEAPHRILGGLVYLQLVRNPGAAFSIATGMTWVLSLIMVAVIVAIIWIVPRLRSVGWALGLGLVLAGAMGNLTDRIFRAPGPLRGHVVDFISVFKPNGDAFAVFNVADSAITVGGVLIVLMALLGKEYDGRAAARD